MKGKNGYNRLSERMPTCCAIVLSRFSHVRLFCDPVDYSPPGFSVHGIFQARILEWVAISSSRGLPDLGIEPVSCVSCIAGGFFTTLAMGKSQTLISRIVTGGGGPVGVARGLSELIFTHPGSVMLPTHSFMFQVRQTEGFAVTVRVAETSLKQTCYSYQHLAASCSNSFALIS